MKLNELYLFRVEFAHSEERQLSYTVKTAYSYIIGRSRKEVASFAKQCAKKGGGYWVLQDVAGPWLLNCVETGKRCRFHNGKMFI